MRKALCGSLIVVTLSLLAIACNTSNSSSSAESKPKITDTDIENTIKAKWGMDTAIKAAELSCEADAETNSATVSGTVELEALRTKAVELARSAQPGLLITDKIVVKPRELSRAEYTEEFAKRERERAKELGEKLGNSLDDAWIHTKIVAQLIGDSDTPQRKINVDVVNNVVTLRGTVNTAEQKAEAERIAKTTEGVKKVVNQLKLDKNA